jgi:hypothetical protein
MPVMRGARRTDELSGAAAPIEESMRIRRGPLFWGLLLIPLGAIPLLARQGVIEVPAATDIWRLWPLVLIGLGIAILLGRRRAGVVATAIVALALGIAAGGALAGGVPGVQGVFACTPGGQVTTVTDAGPGTEAATIDLQHACGTLDVTTSTGSQWTLSAGYRGMAPRVDRSASSLRVTAPEAIGSERQDWTLAVPAAAVREVTIHENAGQASVDLSGASLTSLRAELNAADVRIAAGQATVGRLDVELNAGRARITLGGTTSGRMTVNAGALEVCVPPTAALTFHVTDQLTFAHDLASRGLTQDGETWTRPGTSGATIDLAIDGNAASFTLDPEGGC